jgi:hypothetical protein
MNASETKAGHRVIIKRSMRAVGVPVDNEAPDDQLNDWAKRHPREIARTLGRWFEKAARAWTLGNNSGDSKTFNKACREQGRLHGQAESVLGLWGIVADYPGLYPAFHVKGRTYYSDELERCLHETGATHRVTRDGIELFRSTADECFVWLHRHQGQSVDWACKHEGYAIEALTE